MSAEVALEYNLAELEVRHLPATAVPWYVSRQGTVVRLYSYNTMAVSPNGVLYLQTRSTQQEGTCASQCPTPRIQAQKQQTEAELQEALEMLKIVRDPSIEWSEKKVTMDQVCPLRPHA